MRACMRSSSPKRTAALPRDRLRIGCRQHPCVSGQDRSLCLDPLSATPHIVMPGLVPGISLGAVSAAEMDARIKSGHDGYRIRTSAPGVVALHYPNRRPGLRAGVQPRSSRQPRIPRRFARAGGVRGRPRQSDQLSTGCCGIGSQGWVPAFAGTTKRGQRPAQPGCRAHRMHDHARCVHAVGHDDRGALGHNGAGPCIGATLKRSPGNAG